ncbi:MAG: glycerophosphodiester phosphodiesterase family protein [Acutalibacteraceae bacterium]
MRKSFKLIFTLWLIMAFSVCTFVCASAENSAGAQKLFDNRGGIMSIAYRGDTASYPKNSLEGILSAAKKGADMISVSVRKTSDSVLVLCENEELNAVCDTDKTSVSSVTSDEFSKLKLKNNDGSVSRYKTVSLEEAAKRIGENTVLILDNAWEYYDDVLSLCQNENLFGKMAIRTDVSSKQIKSVAGNNAQVLPVIGIYSANIVFNAQSHLKRLSQAGMPAVQYQSKNYFNVVYGNFTAKNYSKGENARAIAPMYDPDLSGQRPDNVSGWDEMIGLGFSVIETNNIEGLCAYIKQCDETRENLNGLIEKANAVDLSSFSQTSVKNLENAKKEAKVCLENKNTALGKLESACSDLSLSMNSLKASHQSDTQKGSLNITAGKIAAAVIFGALLLAGEVYVFKMRKKEK